MRSYSTLIAFSWHWHDLKSQMADSTNSLVAIACNARLLVADVKEETMGADTDNNVVRRENDTINVDVASLENCRNGLGE
jgi:hypothetical protein